MNKCDFCIKQMPNGDCYWPTQPMREADCERAIQLMVKALSSEPEKKNRRN